MSIVENQTVRFRADRTNAGRAVRLGFEGDHLVRRLTFELPEVDGAQTATLMYGGKYADMIQLEQDGGKWAVDLTAEMIGQAGVVDGYIRVDGAQGEVWQSDVFRIETGDVPEIEVEIEKFYPTAVSQMMTEMARHKAQMDETTNTVEGLASAAQEYAGQAQAEAQRAQQAADALEAPQAHAETLDEGADATAQWTQDAEGKPVLTLGIPKGATGAQGERGEQGIPGERGADGKPGADGKTAYQYAQDGGFAGTEEEFAEQMAQGGYTLPTASQSVLGGVKVGDGLQIDEDGVLSIAEEIDLTDLKQVQKIVQAGKGPQYFAIGDQIIIPWMDVNDGEHNTPQNAYQVPWDVVAHQNVELEDGSIVPGMVLQWHYTLPYNVQYSNSQAFKDCPDGLAAGTYYITFGDNWGSTIVAGESWSFTLTKALPAGGRLSGLENVYGTSSKTWQIKSWADPADAEPQEMVSVSSGANGTSLGTMKLDSINDNLNTLRRAGYGENIWKNSAIRQYLNKSGKNWWQSMEPYDIRPTQYAKNGFLSGMDMDFLTATKPVKVVTATSMTQFDTTYDRIFLPSLEQMYIQPVVSGEGSYWPYWKERLGASEPVGRDTTQPALITTRIDRQTAAQQMNMRSAGVDYASHVVFRISSAGAIVYEQANVSRQNVPVCVIC